MFFPFYPIVILFSYIEDEQRIFVKTKKFSLNFFSVCVQLKVLCLFFLIFPVSRFLFFLTLTADFILFGGITFTFRWWGRI